jgi:outer membrane protein TolC
MRLRIPYRQIPACLLFFSLLASGQAQAGALPWLSQALGDPFAAEKKADHLIAPHLVPASCPEPKPLQRRLHLNDVVIAALCNNPDTRAAYLNLLGQADTYATNYAGYLPSVTATGGQSRTTTFSNHTILVSHAPSYGVAAGLTLYDFGQREFKLEIAEQALIAAGYSYDATLQGMIATALETYFRVLTSQNAVTAAAESEHYARQSYEAARLRHKIGQVPRADELQAKGAYSQAVLASQQARNQLSLDAASLAQLMGLSADASVEVAEIGDAALGKDPFAAPVRALMEQAKRKRNDLLAARAQVEGSKESLEALRRADLATVSATTSQHSYLHGLQPDLQRACDGTAASGAGRGAVQIRAGGRAGRLERLAQLQHGQAILGYESGPAGQRDAAQGRGAGAL